MQQLTDAPGSEPVDADGVGVTSRIWAWGVVAGLEIVVFLAAVVGARSH